MSHTSTETEKPTSAEEYDPDLFLGEVKSNWCPGCGDYGLLKATSRALSRLGYKPHEVVIFSGIGCSSNFPHFTSAYGFHAVHGRALPAATGAYLANSDLKIVVVGGDGDGYAIGLSHFLHACRRNLNVTYMVMNNQIYGLTLGQASPTSQQGHITKITPEGEDERPINPINLALSAGATFVARGFSGEIKHLENIIMQALQHEGFAFVDVLSPCVTFNKLNTYPWFKQRVYDIQKTDHDSKDLAKALTRGLEWGDKIPIGIFYETKELLPLHKTDPVASAMNPSKAPLGFSAMGVSAKDVFDEFK